MSVQPVKRETVWYARGAKYFKGVLTRERILAVPGHLPKNMLWGYSGTYPSIYCGGTPLSTRVYNLGVP